jgi:hypothetical protein
MQDRPTRVELLDAIRGFVEAEVIPAFEGRRRFHARVAANLLAILARELESEEGQWADEWVRLDVLLGATEMPTRREERRRFLLARTEQLCARIRDGDADRGAFREAVLRHVRRTVEEKLAVANPKLLKLDRRAGAEREEER